MNTPAENLCLKLGNPTVRDLAWACFSPAILNLAELDKTQAVTHCALTLTPSRSEWLQALDRDPQALLTHLADRSKNRLGLYFEALWQFFLEQDDRVDLIAHNLPVREAGRTLGEFDCIYYCKQRQRPVHLELAVKFFLHDPRATSAAHSWKGPNSVDRLDLKLQRLLEHQIQLSETTAGSAALAELDAALPLREVEIKGRLYRPTHAARQQPEGYNPALAMQTWCHQSELEQYTAGSAAAYAVLDREQWLAPVTVDTDTLLGSEALCSRLSLSALTRPVQVAIVDPAGDECRRFFVVSDDWPLAR